MRKIFMGIMGLALTIAVVGGTAFALFTDSATVSGINIHAGSVGLLVNGEENFDADLDVNGVYPGWGSNDDQMAEFNLKNDSAGDFDLSITGQLTSANGWNSSALKDWFEIKVQDVETGEMTDWYSLKEWNDGAIPFPGPTLNEDETRDYKVYARMPENAPSSLEGASLTDIVFTIVGTQAGAESTPSPSSSPTPTATPEVTPTPTATPAPTAEPTPTATPAPIE